MKKFLYNVNANLFQIRMISKNMFYISRYLLKFTVNILVMKTLLGIFFPL